MSKRVSLVVLFMVCAMVGNAFAITYNQYKGANGATDWATNTANWSAGVLPQAGPTGTEWKIGFKTANSPSFTSGTLGADVLVVGGTTGNFTVSGTTVNVSQYITLAAATTDVGGVMTLNSGIVNTGVLNANAGFFVAQLGTGVLNMSGGEIHVGLNYTGTLTIAQSAGSNGTLNLTGGQIYANTLAMGGGNGHINIGGQGQIILTGDRLSTVNPWLNSLITASEAGKTVSAQIIGGNTVISAIPEPATIGILGLGLASLLRRKK